MIATRPEIYPAGKYTISRACRELEMHRTTMMRYVEQGIIRVYTSTLSRRRYFKGEDLIKLWEKL